MQNDKLIFLGNLSNEGNLCAVKETELLQLNIAVLIGVNQLQKGIFSRTKIPLVIEVGEKGEVEIQGMDGLTVNDENIRIYSDRKIIQSESDNTV
ncbi:MAG: hypothetical protein GX922_03905 [Firmicutes bacterium]|nr:hypothetical protein [Bacillota bacterium]